MRFRLHLALAATLAATALPAQTLARKNWAGSGLKVAPWYQTATFYQLDPLTFQDSGSDGFGDLAGLTSRLDYLASLHVDALLLTPFPLQPGPSPFDPTYGTEDDFARLLSESTRLHLRVVVDLPISPARPLEETLAAARFWLTRGVAGLRLSLEPASPLTPQQYTSRIQALHRVLSTYPGQRVLITPTHPAELVEQRALESLSTTLDPATWQASLRAAQAAPDSLAGMDSKRTLAQQAATPSQRDALARIQAAILLLGHPTPLLLYGQELGLAPSAELPMQWALPEAKTGGFSTALPWVDPAPNAATANVALEDRDSQSLLNWYRRLADLRHTLPALQTGTVSFLTLADPSVIGWIRKPLAAAHGHPEAPVVILLNLSPRATLVSLTAALGASAKNYANLKTLAPASDQPVPINGILLPAFGLYIGELPPAPGLESVTLPPSHRYHHR